MKPPRQDNWVRTKSEPVPKPPFRRLRGYAFDPSLSVQLETALVNEVIFRIPWEEDGEKLKGKDLSQEFDFEDEGGLAEKGLFPGPVGEYVEVVDYDPASGCFYAPVNLNSPLVLAQDGLAPTEGNPQFHQQMAYAVAMTTIQNFERSLGRFALWAPHRIEQDGRVIEDKFVRRLRIYPHAMREANAYYSPAKKALLFGYFPARSKLEYGDHVPGGLVFTCLSHDIIAHETTHALLDGMHRRYIEPTHPDSRAFHEAFADIVALFQHFSFSEVLRHQISKTRGDLASENLLGQLAQQFGKAIGHYGALRDAIGQIDTATKKWKLYDPDPEAYERALEPHDRGAILVAAVFDAFLSIYRNRVADLFRIASGGTGVLEEGALHPDLINRLAIEASKSSQHLLNMCIRALDYCPPVEITFGDFLRALITSDSDLVRDDDLGYRIAIIEAFRRRGIYPRDVRTLSIDSLRWPLVRDSADFSRIRNFASKLKSYLSTLKEYTTSRAVYFQRTKDLAEKLHNFIDNDLREDIEYFAPHFLVLFNQLEGLDTNEKQLPKFEVHAVRLAQRVGPDGDSLNHAIISLTQKRILPLDPKNPDSPQMPFRGGCTLIFNLDSLTLQYVIGKKIDCDQRLERQRRFMSDELSLSVRATYFGDLPKMEAEEPYALLHRSGQEGR
jgi:hypothetical protein